MSGCCGAFYGGVSGAEDRQVHTAWALHDQDSREEGHQGRQEDDVRQGGEGQGQACYHRGEGIPSEGLEGLHLSPGRRQRFEPGATFWRQMVSVLYLLPLKTGNSADAFSHSACNLPEWSGGGGTILLEGKKVSDRFCMFLTSLEFRAESSGRFWTP